MTIFCANLSYSFAPTGRNILSACTLKQMPEMVKGTANSKWTMESLKSEKSVENNKFLVNEDVRSRKFFVWVDHSSSK